MKFLNSKIAELLSDAFCSVLLGTAVCILLFPVFRMDVGWGESLLFMLANIILIVLFTRKWWILPSILLLAAILSVSVSSLLEANDVVLSYIGGFFQWCASGYTDILPYSVNGSIIIIHAAYVLPVAALVFLFFRKLFFFYIIPPAVFAMLIVAVLSKSAALWPMLVMLLFVLFVSLAKMRGNKISRRHEDSGISSAMLSISAIILMPILLGIVLIAAPKKDNDWLCKPFVNAVQDVVDFLGFNKSASPADGSFSMGLTGFSPLENRLGGDIAVNNDIVLRVKTTTPTRLTGVVFDTYDGTKWYDSFSRQRNRFQSLFSSTPKAEAFDLNKLNGHPRLQELFDKVTMPAEFEITSSLKGRTLFYAGRVTSIQSEKPDTTDIYFNNQSELFTINTHSKFDYTFDAVVFDTAADDFDDNMLALERLTAPNADPALAGVKAEYLPLPDTVPQSVYDTARDITADCKTPYEKALALRHWLSTQCSYTLTPGNPPEGEDFVASFLQQRQGYCVYFASAMTVMSRCVGLPARYVIGFGLKKSPYTKAIDSYMATNAMAHAWTEIYFQGIGWVPFDATGWNFSENAVVETAPQSPGYVPPIPTPGMETISNLDKQALQDGHMPQALVIALISLAGLLILLAVFILARYLMLQRHGSGLRLARKYTSDNDKMNLYYRRILNQAACLGIRQLPSDTISSLAERVDTRLGEQQMAQAVAPIILVRFGREDPGPEDMRRLSAFSDELERRLRRELGFFGYLWARIIKSRRLP